MANKKIIKKPTAKKTLTPEICELKHINVDEKFKNLENKIDVSIFTAEQVQNMIRDVKENNKIIDAYNKTTYAEQKLMAQALKDQIKLTESSIYGKLDKVNETLKGNGKVGIIEQIRTIKWCITGIMFCLALLLGGKITGVGPDEIKSYFSKKTTTTQQTTTTEDNHPIAINIYQQPSDTNTIKDANSVILKNTLKQYNGNKKP